jgi:sphinganine-1-phosphate aldolase
MERVLVAAFQRYCVSNPLHPDVFPAIRKMEAEIVAMCLRMYNNPTGAGATTSGGTESILMSVKTHRDWARAVKGICEPEMYALVRLLPVYLLKRLVGCSQNCPCVGSRRL